MNYGLRDGDDNRRAFRKKRIYYYYIHYNHSVNRNQGILLTVKWTAVRRELGMEMIIECCEKGVRRLGSSTMLRNAVRRELGMEMIIGEPLGRLRGVVKCYDMNMAND
ncbi:hypothetical protein DPMN_038872 [Dreissena polymorpha]|uniref:Uncharacterized protein n=1 Tax=Dreissena polymorpha TaxID=45954 RepID=A0A9D4MDK1_DREPO|nr:hypothetical protein DPMN_038872 [Dreissena polymorpha]